MTTLRQKISQFAAYQRTVRELNQLSNVQLRDLGITRDDTIPLHYQCGDARVIGAGAGKAVNC